MGGRFRLQAQARTKPWAWRSHMPRSIHVPTPSTDKKETSNFEGMNFVLKLLALLSVGMYFYGYGVALAYGELFQMPPSLFFSSPLDLLWLGVEALPFMLERLSSVDLLNPAISPNWQQDFRVYAVSGLGVALIWLLAVVLYRQKWRASLASKAKTALPARDVLANESMARVVARSVGYGVGTFIVLSLLRYVGVLMILCAFGISVLPVAFGYRLGYWHGLEHIVLPSRCAPVLNQMQLTDRLKKVATRNPPAQATCLSVTYTENRLTKVALGRYVTSTGESMFIYDVNRHVQRIPIKAAVIEPAELSGTPMTQPHMSKPREPLFKGRQLFFEN